MAMPLSSLPPPRYVEYTRALPEALSSATKASPRPSPYAWRAFDKGKSVEEVLPVTNALPDESTAMPDAASPPAPPRRVEYIKALPAGLNFVTKTARKDIGRC